MNTRAEIFTPSGKSGYAKDGNGGVSTDRAPAQKPAPTSPAPTPSAPTPSAPTPSAKAQGQALAETVVGSLVDRMTSLAKEKGGTLTLDDIQSLGAEMQQQTAALSTVFEQTLEQTAKTGQNWDQMRKAPFDRIAVKTFAHMFADGTQLKDQKMGISRRMLPGFFMAVNMMLGEENVRDLQTQCTTLLDQLRAEKGDGFQWAHFYEHATARALLIDATANMALHFENFGRREAWFLDLINSHLSPADEPESPAADWQLTAPTFYRFLNALFDTLKKEMAGDGRAAIAQRHGNENVARLEGVLTVISGRDQN